MSAVAADTTRLAAVVDLKRIRFGGASVAERGFLRAWAALDAGRDPVDVATAEAGRALGATVLGAIDPFVLLDAGLSEDGAATVVAHAAREAGANPEQAAAAGRPLRGYAPVPGFVPLLAASPRAGVTAPGRTRYVLEPTESHAEHCWVVAVLAAIVAPDPDTAAEAFLCGLAHHLHNAWLPDGGFAGEEALGVHLEPVLNGLRARGAAMLSTPGLGARALEAIALTGHADTPAAVAFNTADVLDRVLELRFHERSAAFTLREAVEDYEIVHAGPLQDFGMDLLRERGLA